MRYPGRGGFLSAIAVSMVVISGPLTEAVPSFPNSLTVMSYNIREGRGNDGNLDLSRVAAVIDAIDPDIVALQEVDKNTEGSGYLDQTAALAGLTQMPYYEFGKARDWDRGDLGNAILSQYPFEVINNYPLPKNKRNEEPRAALFLEIDVSSLYGGVETSITVIGTHLDHKQKASRIQAASFIETILAGLPDRPALLVGDLNDVPGSPTLNAFDLFWTIEDLGQTLPTYPAEAPTRQLDYVLWGYPFNRTDVGWGGGSPSCWHALSEVRGRAPRPGSAPMRTAWTTWSGCGGPLASSARSAATTEAGGWAMDATGAPGAAAGRR